MPQRETRSGLVGALIAMISTIMPNDVVVRLPAKRQVMSKNCKRRTSRPMRVQSFIAICCRLASKKSERDSNKKLLNLIVLTSELAR